MDKLVHCYEAVGARDVLYMVLNVLDIDQKKTSLSEAVVAALVCTHKSVKIMGEILSKSSGRNHYLSPRYVLMLF